MKRAFAVLFSGLLLSCSGVTKNDFRSKTFQVSYNTDSTQSTNLPQVSPDLLPIMQIEYEFNSDDKGVSWEKVGAINKEKTFTWHVSGDSLTIKEGARPAMAFKVEKQESGAMVLKGNGSLLQLRTKQ